MTEDTTFDLPTPAANPPALTPEQIAAFTAQIRQQMQQEMQQQLEQMRADLAAAKPVTEAGIPVDYLPQPGAKSWPARKEDKLKQRAEQSGGAWHPQLGSQYTECTCRDKMGCQTHWTPKREHREKFALGMCTCAPEPEEPRDTPATALANGDVANPRPMPVHYSER